MATINNADIDKKPNESTVIHSVYPCLMDSNCDSYTFLKRLFVKLYSSLLLSQKFGTKAII